MNEIQPALERQKARSIELPAIEAQALQVPKLISWTRKLKLSLRLLGGARTIHRTKRGFQTRLICIHAATRHLASSSSGSSSSSLGHTLTFIPRSAHHTAPHSRHCPAALRRPATQLALRTHFNRGALRRPFASSPAAPGSLIVVSHAERSRCVLSTSVYCFCLGTW